MDSKCVETLANQMESLTVAEEPAYVAVEEALPATEHTYSGHGLEMQALPGKVNLIKNRVFVAKLTKKVNFTLLLAIAGQSMMGC